MNEQRNKRIKEDFSEYGVRSSIIKAKIRISELAVATIMLCHKTPRNPAADNHKGLFCLYPRSVDFSRAGRRLSPQGSVAWLGVALCHHVSSSLDRRPRECSGKWSGLKHQLPQAHQRHLLKTCPPTHPHDTDQREPHSRVPNRQGGAVSPLVVGVWGQKTL